MYFNREFPKRSYIENHQPVPLKWGLCSVSPRKEGATSDGQDEYKITAESGLFSCRDILNKYVYSVTENVQLNRAYGFVFNLKKDKWDTDKFRLLMACPHSPELVEKTEKFINSVCRKAEVPEIKIKHLPVTPEHTKNTNTNIYLLEAPLAWRETTWAASLFTLLIRMHLGVPGLFTRYLNIRHDLDISRSLGYAEKEFLGLVRSCNLSLVEAVRGIFNMPKHYMRAIVDQMANGDTNEMAYVVSAMLGCNTLLKDYDSYSDYYRALKQAHAAFLTYAKNP